MPLLELALVLPPAPPDPPVPLLELALVVELVEELVAVLLLAVLVAVLLLAVLVEDPAPPLPPLPPDGFVPVPPQAAPIASVDSATRKVEGARLLTHRG
ncbi:Hypothetical protein A7982_04397 [Minicystis rosea]|nr:Hypothetical protein A7982_04397 [Minicystis rosea]